MLESELKEALKGFIGKLYTKETELRIKNILSQYKYNCEIVEEDPELKALKRELGINDDHIVEVEFNIDIPCPVNTVKIDLTV